MADQSNGTRSLAQEMAQTKERLAAWIFRGLMFLVTTFGAGIVGLGVWVFNDFKEHVEKDNTMLWQTVGKNQTDLGNAISHLGLLSQQVADSIKTQSDLMERLQREEDQHDERLRELERTSPSH